MLTIFHSIFHTIFRIFFVPQRIIQFFMSGYRASQHYNSLFSKIADIDEIKSILEQPGVAQKIIDNNCELLRYAIISKNLEMLDALLSIQSIEHAAVANGHTLLVYAITHNSLSILNRLLAIEAISENVAANDNFLLNFSAAHDQIDILNRLLEFDAVVQNITVNHNAAVLVAELVGHQRIVDRLMEFPAVREAVLAADDVSEELSTIALDRENSMRQFNAHERGIVQALKARYPHIVESHEEKEKVLKALKSHLEEYCKKENLSLSFDKNSPTEPLLNVAHQAWRYLFARPNPWMSPEARFVAVTENGTESDLRKNSWLLLMLVWSLLNDNTAKLNEDNRSYIIKEGVKEEDIRESLRKTFIQTMAFAGREHNYDLYETQDDGGYDKPCCGLGANQRILQGALGFEIAENPLTRSFNVKSLAERFKEQLITSDDDGLKPILMTMGIEDLNVLKGVLDKIILAEHAFNSEEMDKLQLIRLSDSVDLFIEKAKEFFTQLHWRALVNFNYQGDTYKNCEEFVKTMADKPWMLFFTELYLFVEQAIELKTTKEALVFSETALPILSKCERNEDDYESDSEMPSPKAFKSN